MTAMLRTTQRHWAVAGAGAAAVGALVVLLFRHATPPSPPPAQAPHRPTVTLVNATDQALNDEAVLLDPTPLFLPTKWNATQRELAPPDPGGRFQGFDAPKLSFAENELKLGLPAPIAVPAGPAEAVAADAPTAVLAGFGRVDVPEVGPAARGAFVEVRMAGNGRKVLAQAIPGAPPGQGGWAPVEFVARVDAAGLVGPLVVTERSGLEEVDIFFANYLARTLRVGERLAPGFYRICVGP